MQLGILNREGEVYVVGKLITQQCDDNNEKHMRKC